MQSYPPSVLFPPPKSQMALQAGPGAAVWLAGGQRQGSQCPRLGGLSPARGDQSQADTASRHRNNVLSRPKKTASVPLSLPSPDCRRVVTSTAEPLPRPSPPPGAAAVMDGGPREAVALATSLSPWQREALSVEAGPVLSIHPRPRARGLRGFP